MGLSASRVAALALGLLALLAAGIWVIFRRRRYIAPDGR